MRGCASQEFDIHKPRSSIFVASSSTLRPVSLINILSNYTLPTDQLFNLEFQFESVLKVEFQPKFGIQLGIPISMGINLGECSATTPAWNALVHSMILIESTQVS